MSIFTGRWRMSRRATGFTVAATSVAVLLVVQVVAVLWGGSRLVADASAATRQTFSYVADLSEERVATYVTSAELVATDLAEATASGQLTPEESLRVLYREIATRGQVRAASVTWPDGSFALVRRNDAGSGFVSRVIAVRPDGSVDYHLRSHDGNFQVMSDDTAPIDLQLLTADTYTLALRSAGPAWTDPAVRTVTRRTGVWVTQAVRGGGGELTAVVAADIELDELSKVLNDLPLGPDGEAFLLGANRTVIAAPLAYTAQLDTYAANFGLVMPADALGVQTTDVARPDSAGDAFGQDGKLMVLERGLENENLNWVVHIRASEVGLSPAIGGVQRTVVSVTAVVLVAVLVAAFVLLRAWRPMRRIRNQALLDPLTSLGNRHAFDRDAPLILREAERRGQAVCVAIMDLDNFKDLNDTRGHDAGDRALVTVARVLGMEIRESDVAVRWGGDEFVVVLSLPDATLAPSVVERIRTHVHLALSLEAGAPTHLGATAGYAVSGGPGDVMRDVLERADRALLRGKSLAKGRSYADDGTVGAAPGADAAQADAKA